MTTIQTNLDCVNTKLIMQSHSINKLDWPLQVYLKYKIIMLQRPKAHSIYTQFKYNGLKYSCHYNSVNSQGHNAALFGLEWPSVPTRNYKWLCQYYGRDTPTQPWLGVIVCNAC